MYLSRVSGIVKDGVNDIHGMFKDQLDDFEYILPDEPLLMGIDQSTSNTGIAIRNFDKSFVMVMDLYKPSSLQKEYYMQHLTILINKLVKGKDIRLCVHEKLPPSKYARAGRVLSELIGYIKSWWQFIPEFSLTERKDIFPQQWKSVIMDKTKGKGRFYNKAEIAADIVDKNPFLAEYYEYAPTIFPKSYDFDAFEALGIIDGYIEYYNALDLSNAERISHSDNKYITSYNVVYRVINKSILDEDPYAVFFAPMVLDIIDLDRSNPRVEILDEKFSLFENFRIATQYRGISVFLTDDPLLQLNMQMECGYFTNEDEMICCYFVPRCSECESFVNLGLRFPNTFSKDYSFPKDMEAGALTADLKKMMKQAKLMNS